MGYAMAARVPVVISGPERSVFEHTLPPQRRFTDHNEAFEYLTRTFWEKEPERTLSGDLGPNAYQALAMRTMNSPLDRIKRKAMCALGVAGEAGEVADYMKKVLFHGISMDREKLVKELGDVCWYIATLAHECSIPLAEVLEKNIEKLKKRYPAGFSTEASIARADGEINDQDAEYKS
jgi:NTP pyrophosphatase (non-canonical NTP hydrolase)